MSILDNDYLLLSGIQHMAFCERQWALIHVEQIWAENVRTVEGKHLHERADNPYFDESRKNTRIVRSMPIISNRLRLRGIADVVEFHLKEEPIKGETCQIEHRKGWWAPIPVEYKRGRVKKDDRDAVQLCAQAMALEEMLNVSIPTGFLFYGQTKRRESIPFTNLLRQRTVDLSFRMWDLMQKGMTPKAQKGKHCSLCSLVESCQPAWMIKPRSVKKYIVKMCNVEEDACESF